VVEGAAGAEEAEEAAVDTADRVAISS
jgi:hypothetical protein